MWLFKLVLCSEEQDVVCCFPRDSFLAAGICSLVSLCSAWHVQCSKERCADGIASSCCLGLDSRNKEVWNFHWFLDETFLFLYKAFFFCRQLRVLPRRRSRWKFVKFVEPF